ncbi:MAG: ECF transporter S component [Oscillospiraceae bacterium]|nr:ECF transporter S component [Oscillospiraceae bacterium]
MNNSTYKTRKMVTSAVLGAVSSVLMFFSFNVPFMPSFIKMDFSELPALLAAYAYGPLAGVTVCFIKNAVNLISSSTGGVGELSNFMLGCMFVVPRGYIYGKLKTKTGAVAGAFIGAVSMAVAGLFTNYYVVYPVYTVFMPMDVIIGMYSAILPGVETLWQALIVFNMPFTFFKGMVNMLIAMYIYKPLSPLLKGRK